MRLRSNCIKDSPNRQSSSNSSSVLSILFFIISNSTPPTTISMASSSTPATTGSYAHSLKSLNRCLDRLPKDVDVREWGEEFADLLVSPNQPILRTFTNRFITAPGNGRPSIHRRPPNGRMAQHGERGSRSIRGSCLAILGGTGCPVLSKWLQ